MHSLNKFGKIVINSKEVYYGCIADIDYTKKVAKLKVVDWRDYTNNPNIKFIHFAVMDVPTDQFTIKYEENSEGMDE